MKLEKIMSNCTEESVSIVDAVWQNNIFVWAPDGCSLHIVSTSILSTPVQLNQHIMKPFPDTECFLIVNTRESMLWERA